MWNDRYNPAPMANNNYWEQWDSHYGPMNRRSTMRQHQINAMFAPTMVHLPDVSALAHQSQALSGLLPKSLHMQGLLDRMAVTEAENRLMPPQNGPLYYDFNAPARPNVLTIRCAVQSFKADIQWNTPRINKGINYMFKIKISGSSKGEMNLEYPAWKTNASIDLEAGNWYTITVEAVSSGRILAVGDVSFKSILCAAEMAMLQTKAIGYLQNLPTGSKMQEIVIFYRNKPPEYWQQIQAFDSIMRPYLKDQGGNPGSPINGEINGLFFAARLHAGQLPTSSPFGGQRLKLMCPKLFLPETHNMYFGDFYCNTYVHYVTVVICYKNSQVDLFCRDKLDLLDPFNNLFLRVSVDEFGNYRYFINNNVWVEVYCTGDVPLWWGEFDYTISLGQSKPNGIPNNKFCTICNLYPLEPPPTPPADAARLKRRLSREDSRSYLDDEVSFKKLRSNWVDITLPADLSPPGVSATGEAESSSTFLLTMALSGRQSSLASVDSCVNDIDEYLPDVADITCLLIDEAVEQTRDTQASYSKNSQNVKRETSPDNNEPKANNVKLSVPSDIYSSSKILDSKEESALVERITSRKDFIAYLETCDDDFSVDKQTAAHNKLNGEHRQFIFPNDDHQSDRDNVNKFVDARFEIAEIDSQLKKLKDSFQSLKNHMQYIDRKFVSLK